MGPKTKAKLKAQRLAAKARKQAGVERRKAKRAIKSVPRKALAEWSRQARAVGKCAVCGDTEHLNAHHILPKERYKTLKLDPMNAVCLCPSCHKYDKYSAHRNPIWFAEWLGQNRNPQYLWALEHMDDL